MNWTERTPSCTTSKPWILLDLDQTLIRPQAGRPFPKDASDWEWLRSTVPEVLRAWADAGNELILVSNQTKVWKRELITSVCEALSRPMSIVVAFAKEDHKPSTRLFRSLFPEDIPNGSFFVGDAAGRPNDHSDCDRAFAAALGIPFKLPEEVFPMPRAPVMPLPHLKIGAQELILMIGSPAAGKSTIARMLAETHHALHLEVDVLKTPSKVKREALAHPQSPWILDATHGTRAKREEWIVWAKSVGRTVRCIWLKTPLETALDRSAQRAHEGGASVPKVALYTYRKRFEAPVLEEGFTEIVELDG